MARRSALQTYPFFGGAYDGTSQEVEADRDRVTMLAGDPPYASEEQLYVRARYTFPEGEVEAFVHGNAARFTEQARQIARRRRGGP
jgi:hypothetical protein